MKVYFGWKNVAGLICFEVGDTCVHLGVKRDMWFWGPSEVMIAPAGIFLWGLGPLLLVARMPW